MELLLNIENINILSKTFILKINNLINNWALLTKLSNVKHKPQNESLITKG